MLGQLLDFAVPLALHHVSSCLYYCEGEVVCAVGQLAAHCAFVRGADRVIIIDDVEYRLQYAKDHMPKIETINFDKVKVRTPRSTIITKRHFMWQHHLVQVALFVRASIEPGVQCFGQTDH